MGQMSIFLWIYSFLTQILIYQAVRMRGLLKSQTLDYLLTIKRL